MREVPNQVKEEIEELAKIISSRGVQPMRLWEQNNVPPEVNERYHSFLSKFVGGLPLWNEQYPGQQIPNPLTAMAVYETFHLLSERYVENENILKEYANKSYTVVEKRGLLLETYPELKERISKYGLIELPKGISIMGGKENVDGFTSAAFGLRYKKHILLLDKGFRRACYKNNHFNVDFIQRLSAFHFSSSSTVKVRFDPDMMGLPDSGKMYKESDYWHGQPFKIDNLDDPGSVGLAVHRHGDEFTSDGKYRTRLEILWFLQQDDNKIKVVEVEEQFGEDDVLGRVMHDGNYFCRYVHAKRNMSEGRFIHFDGSVNTYNEKQYTVRQSRYFGQDTKLGTHTKMFQIDGDISFEQFNNLMQYFYRGNILVPEYFGEANTVPLIAVGQEK